MNSMEFRSGDIVKNVETGEFGYYVAALKSRHYQIRLISNGAIGKVPYGSLVPATKEQAGLLVRESKSATLHIQHEEDYSVLEIEGVVDDKTVRIKLNSQQLGTLLNGKSCVAAKFRIVKN